MKATSWQVAGLLFVLGGFLGALGLLASPRFLGASGGLAALTPHSLALGLLGGALVLAALASIVLAPAGLPVAARRNYGSHGTVLGLTLVAGLGSFAVVLPALGPLAGVRQPTVAGFVLSAVVLDVALVGVVYLRVVRPRVITWHDMGLSAVRQPRVWLAGLVASIVLFALAASLELLMKAAGVQQTQLASLEWLRSVPLWQYLLVAFSAAILAPIAEEIYFRGYVFRAYFEQKGPLQAYLFSSLLFALVHLNLPAIIPIFGIGLFLAFLYHRTGSVLPGMIAHAVNNAVAFAILYLGT